MVLGEMLGIDPSLQAEHRRLTAIISAGVLPLASEGERESVLPAANEIEADLTAAIEERRRQGRDDLISGLIEAEEGGDRLSTAEVLSTVTLLHTAGNSTTTQLIGNGIFALLCNPSEFEKLRADPALIVNAVEEMLRFDSPVIGAPRITLKDMEVGGCPIKAGDSLVASLGAANHDPRLHPDPHTFDIEREGIHHQSFGGGARYCLGASLARLEAQVATNALLRHFPNLELADQDFDHRVWPPARGFVRLIVRTLGSMLTTAPPTSAPDPRSP